MTLTIDLDTAERLVTQSNQLYWDGWTLVHIKPNPGGWLKSNGVLFRGKWHVQNRYPVGNDGKYTIPKALGNGLQS